MPRISAIGKYLDQPLLTAKLNKNIPAILGVGSSVVFADAMLNTPKEERKNNGIRLGVTLAATALSAINAPKIAAYITGRKPALNISKLKSLNTDIVDDFLKNNTVNERIGNILEKSKEKILSLKEIALLFKNNQTKDIANKLIPPPDNITSKEIFREIGWLSVYGAVPVAGGIAGGIIGDKITDSKWKEKVPNKIKEGTYQYLANIFLCNIGAGIALGILEISNIKSKAARCIGMVAGILLTGVIGGSVIANYIGKKLINPLINNKSDDVRTPELLDLGLHTDDIATVSLLSGLKWIEPSLPLLYSVSGYRAGIGYRNNTDINHKK